MAVLPQLPPWVLYPILFISFFIVFFYLLVLFRREHMVIKSDYFPDITIIIPAKNVENTLEKCVESVIKQDYKGKINVLIVNDVSKDNTFRIAKELVRKYKKGKRRVMVIERKKSLGRKSQP